MSGNGQRSNGTASFDAVIVGASLAGCTAAIKLGKAGARVALVERQSDPAAFKKVCSHFIQASGVPTLERLGLLDALLAAGAVRPRFRVWTRWGWIVAPPERAQVGLNLRREVLDPLVREAALATPGVESLLGHSAERLLWESDRAASAAGGAGSGGAGSGGARGAAGAAGLAGSAGGRITGVVVRDRTGAEQSLRARLVIGADGRGSRIAKLAGVRERVTPHGRFAYGGYFEGPSPAGAPDASVWMLDPQWGAAFPTDSGLTFYAAMPTKQHLPEFRSDPERALVSFLSDMPDAPPIRDSRRVGDIMGKLEMPNVTHEPVAPGLALIGDAAMAIDPLFGIGCGWALQSGEWLADAVGPALAGGPSCAGELETGLQRYRKRWVRGLKPHARIIEPLSGGRPFDPFERMMFSAAARDSKVALKVDAVGARTLAPIPAVAPVLPRMIAVNVRHALSRRPRYAENRSAVAATAVTAASSPAAQEGAPAAEQVA
ncbi:MAG TPA: NAD(P)/FAD-dependent oxidoreductase [Conexibacter sp.]|jgi:2-polyprenyl-6-methoxyphenol hydroxylase-like FAD-dependent oxidoreductase